MREKVVKALLVFIPTLVLIVLYFVFLVNANPFENSKKDVHHDYDDYAIYFNINDKMADGKFSILQLTDIHLSVKDDLDRQFAFLTKTIETANPDYIVICGDLFTFADKDLAIKTFAFFDSFKIHWSITFGNHDEQCYFSIDWLTSYLNDLTNSRDSYCVFIDNQDDDVFGNSNYYVNLMYNGSLFEQIIIMDSNRYNYSVEYIGYDYIKESQIDWYKRIVNRNVDSLLFCHIPIPEYETYYEEYENGNPNVTLVSGVKNEKSCVPKYNSGFFDAIKEIGKTKAICCGHDHLNNFTLKVQYGSQSSEYIYLSYGVNATDRIYFTEELLGGRVIEIDSETHNLEFKDIIIPYSDYEGGNK